MSAPIWSKVLQFFPTLLKGNSGATPTVDWGAGSVQSITLNAATVTPTFLKPVGGCNLALVITQDGTGGRAVTWPAAVSWIGGTPPILLSGAGQTTLVYFYWDGTTYWGSLQSGASPASIIPWTAVAAGTALAASLARPNLAADSSGAQSTITLPSAASMASSDGYEFTIKATGNMASPVIVTAGAGTTVELLNAPGTFGASTWLPIQGQSVVFKYDLSTTTWKVRASSEGSSAAGASGYNPGWYAAGTIFVDPAAGVDSAKGTTNVTALKSYAEALRRWGTNAPYLTVSTSITFLSSHTDNTDPVVWRPYLVAGAIPTIQGTTATVTTATVFTRSAQKSRAAGTNSLLAGSFAAGAPAQGVLVQNTTALKSSRAWIYKTAGGANWNMGQPMAPQTLPVTNASVPAEVDTWASTDTVNLLGQVKVNVVEFTPEIVDFNGGFTNVGQLYNLVVFDPGGVGNFDPLYVNNSVCITECAIQRTLILTGANPFEGLALQNCALLGGYVATSGTGNTVMNGGFVISAIQLQGTSFQPDGDAILGAAGFYFGATHFFGIVYLDASQTMQAGSMAFQTSNYGYHVIYGSAGSTFNFAKTSSGIMRTTSFTVGWTAPALVNPGVLLNSASTGNSIAYAANVGTIHNGIATTVANLDAAAGAAGFGGTAFNPGGASVSTQN